MKNNSQRMKCSSSALLSLVLLIHWFSVSWAFYSDSDRYKFEQCLYNYSQPSNPISGAIVDRSMDKYFLALVNYVRNLRYLIYGDPEPMVIIQAMHESHIQATIFCAKEHDFQIGIRSGGHDYEGLSYVSYVNYIVIDMFNLRSINIDIENENAWVQAGATLGELYYAIAKKSKVHGFPAGICPTLCTGGHFSGGGYGNMMRKYGLSVDNIVDAQIIDVNGKILNRESMGEDLFWAIRGGGGASFGVILSWKIKLVPVPATVTVFSVERSLEQGATDIVYRWQEVADKLHKDLFIRLRLEAVDGNQKGKKTIKASFIAFFLGGAERLVQLMNGSFPELGFQQKDCMEMSWIESTLFWNGFPNGTSIDVLLKRIPYNPKPWFKRKSDYVKEPIPKTGLESLWKKMIEVENVSMQWNPYGGRMSEISKFETPFPHRAGNIYKIQYSTNWRNDVVKTEVDEHYLNLTRVLYDSMTPYVSTSPRQAFLNYRDLDIGSTASGYTNYTEAIVYGTKYFKGNFERLVRVKTMVDPDNFFKNEQSIPLSHRRGR